MEYVFQSYPSFRYHAEHKPIIVSDPDDEALLAPASKGWVKSPADVHAVESAPAPDPMPVMTDSPILGKSTEPVKAEVHATLGIEPPAMTFDSLVQANKELLGKNKKGK